MTRRSTMSGQGIPLVDRARSAINVFRAHRRSQFSNAEAAVRHHRNMVDLVRDHCGCSIEGARVLDLGCGQQVTQTLLFHADGASVTGIDTEVPTHRMTPGVFRQSWQQNGPERAVKSLARHVLFDSAFYGELARVYGHPLDRSGLDLRLEDATAMRFEDDTFDFVYSMAVFEHIEDVEGAVREVNRVLKPGGLAVITPHLFPSISGGHNLEWSRPDEAPSPRVPAWDHLREHRFPANTYLNRWKRADYDRAFRNGLTVVEELMEREGESILTPELETELTAAGYTRDDLLTKTVMYLCRKKSAGTDS